MHMKRIIVIFSVFAFFMSIFLLFYSNTFLLKPILTNKGMLKNNTVDIQIVDLDLKHKEIVEKYFETRKDINTSLLGNYLFKNKPLPKKKDKQFKILMWKVGKAMEARHLRYFTKITHDPFEHCSVNNCELTYKNEDLPDADAVIFLLHRVDISEMPDPHAPRPPDQRWVFLTDESPLHTFKFGSTGNGWQNLAGVFNWSMNYKMEADVPVPYGRTVSFDKIVKLQDDSEITPEILSLLPYPEDKQRKVLVAAMISNCGVNNGRLKYIKELQKYIDVDIYGRCGTDLKNACPGHYGDDCKLLSKYWFYLSFENSNCDQYLTEKVFWNAYTKGAVPIIMGPKPQNCAQVLPPDSYLNTWDYARPMDLARHLLFLNTTGIEEFYKLHNWRRHFKLLNEHGYHGSFSYHYCRICEALNYNDPSPKVYNNLSAFLNPQENCHASFEWDRDIDLP